MKNPKRMTPGWIKSSQGTYSVMDDKGKFTVIYKDPYWDFNLSPKEFTVRVNQIKKELYKQIETYGIIPLKKVQLPGLMSK